MSTSHLIEGSTETTVSSPLLTLLEIVTIEYDLITLFSVSLIRSLVAIIPQTDMKSGTFQMAGRYHAIGMQTDLIYLFLGTEVMMEQFISTVLGTALCLQLESFAAKYLMPLELIKLCVQ